MSRQLLSTALVAAAVSRRATAVAAKLVQAALLLGLLSGALRSDANAPASTPGSGLRPITRTALQALLAKTARELHVPGAVISLRTPQGEFTATYGTTRLGSRIRPQRVHPFSDRLDHQDDDLGGGPAAGPGRQAAARRPDLEVRCRRAERPQHHPGRAARDAQRPVRLHQRPRDGGVLRPSADEGLDPAGSAGDLVRAAAQLPAGHGLRIQQHQLRAARPRHREGGLPAAGRGDAGTVVPAARHEAHLASRQNLQQDSRAVLRTATCTAAPRSSRPASRTRPILRRS